MKPTLIAQGAEAKIFLNNSIITKQRIPKSYRLKKIDETIRKKRTKSEIRLIQKASKCINTPKLMPTKEAYTISMKHINGKKLSMHFDTLQNKGEIAQTLGKEVAKLHRAHIIHGDLTTSNLILVETSATKKSKTSASVASEKGVAAGGAAGNPKNKIFFIDFGLGFGSDKIEDKAVDLHLLKQALNAKHFKHYETLWTNFVKGYKTCKDAPKILERLTAVERRGRYKKGS